MMYEAHYYRALDMYKGFGDEQLGNLSGGEPLNDLGEGVWRNLSKSRSN